jgi:hypothetical protein
MRHIACLLICIVICTIVRSQTAIQTSFESAQGYNAGNVSSQNQWTVTSNSGSGAIINTLAKTGSQALKLSATGTALRVDHLAFSGSVPGITGDVYADMWVYPVTVTTKNFAINGYDLYGGSSKRIFVVEFTTGGQIRAFNGSSSSSSVVGNWTSGQWIRISVKVDFSAEKYKVAVNGNVYATDLSFRETYTPTASGTRVATTKEFHSLRFNHLTDTDIATSDVTVDDIYIGTSAISDVSFGASANTRTITVTQPAIGTITLNPASGPYTLGQSVTATLTLPQGYVNNGWTGDLSGTSLVNTFTVATNMAFSANVGIDPVNPPPTFTVTVNQPTNGTITLSPAAVNNTYYKETNVTATVTYEACYQFNNWTGDLSGTQASKSFVVQNNMSIGADVTPNATPAVKRIVSSVTEFKNALAAMNPGDTVEVNDGDYNLSSLTITRSGCSSKPIVIMAKNQGLAVLNGSTALILRNINYVTIKGFLFQSANIGTGIKLENCTRMRITQNTFNYTENASCTWVYIGDTYGSTSPLKSGYNRIDHNIFDGKTQAGNFIRLDGNIDTQTQYDTIDHNHFKNNGPRATNEKESIRIGVSTLSRSSGFTTVEYNLFQDCDGDPEVVSVKSNDNIIRYNTFQRCLGTLCIRQSFRTTVEGNYFFGEGKTAVFNGGTIGCGGIRVYGKDHKIINNYFSGLTGEKWDAAITITNGDVTNSTTSTTEHNLPENVVFAYNTLVNNKSNIEIGFNNNGNYTKPPLNCLIENNIIIDNTNPIVKSYSAASLAGVSFSNNIFYPTATSTIGISATNAQVMNVDPKLSQLPCTDQGSTCTSAKAYQVLRLDGTSPAVNASTGVYSYVTLDMEKKPRIGVKDIGAHEYTGNSVVMMSALDETHVGPNAIDLSYNYYYTALPVKLISFTAKLKGKNVYLNWTVTNEINFSSYEVEWSTNGSNYEKISSIKGINAANYQSVHSTPSVGVNYYRLKMIDKDGKYSYSPVRTVDVRSKSFINVYPNPAKQFLTLTFDNTVTKAEIRLISAVGTVVKRFQNVTGLQYTISVADLASGYYTIQLVQSSTNIISQKIQIVK